MPQFADMSLQFLIGGVDYRHYARRSTLRYGSDLGWNFHNGLGSPVSANGQLTYFSQAPDFGLAAQRFEMNAVIPGHDPILQWSGTALAPELRQTVTGDQFYVITFQSRDFHQLGVGIPSIFEVGGTTDFLSEYFDVSKANTLAIGTVSEDNTTIRELMRKAALYVTAFCLEDKEGNFFLLSQRKVFESGITPKEFPSTLEVMDDEYLIDAERIGLVRNSIIARTVVQSVDEESGFSQREIVGGDSFTIDAQTNRTVRLPLTINDEISFGDVHIENIELFPITARITVVLNSVVDKTAIVTITNTSDIIQGTAVVSFQITSDVRRDRAGLSDGMLGQTTGVVPRREIVGGDVFEIPARTALTTELDMFIEGAESFRDVRIENLVVTPGTVENFDITLVSVAGRVATVRMVNNQDIIQGIATVSFSLTAEVSRLATSEVYGESNVNSISDYLPRGAEVIDWYPPSTDFAYVNAWLDARRALNFRKNPLNYHALRLSMWQESVADTIFVAELEVGDIYSYNGDTVVICQIEFQFSPNSHRPYKVLHGVEIDTIVPEEGWVLGGLDVGFGQGKTRPSELGTNTILLSDDDPPPPDPIVVRDYVRPRWNGRTLSWGAREIAVKYRR